MAQAGRRKDRSAKVPRTAKRPAERDQDQDPAGEDDSDAVEAELVDEAEAGALAFPRRATERAERATPLARYDPLQAYMRDVQRHRLLTPEAEDVVRESLLPLAALVTPNLDEAAILTGRAVHDEASMARAGETLLSFGAGAALVKGGHLAGDEIADLLVTPDGVRALRHRRVETSSTHGTGCTLSAAITAGLALGRVLETAVADALDFVHRAIAAAPGLGGGHGPLNHTVPPPSSEPPLSSRA